MNVSAKNERTAFLGTLGGGLFYFAFAFVPVFIAYSATVIDPSYQAHFKAEDAREVQKILPALVLHDTPVWCQTLFFGAVLSAILSTASGTLLAPASVLTENVLQPFTKHFGDKTMLWLLRALLVLVAIVATSISVSSESTMYEMVESGYKVTLVVAFAPLVCGIYWSRANTQGASQELVDDDQKLHLPGLFNEFFFGFLLELFGGFSGESFGKSGIRDPGCSRPRARKK